MVSSVLLMPCTIFVAAGEDVLKFSDVDRCYHSSQILNISGAIWAIPH